jgi:hypothetical protein
VLDVILYATTINICIVPIFSFYSKYDNVLVHHKNMTELQIEYIRVFCPEIVYVYNRLYRTYSQVLKL